LGALYLFYGGEAMPSAHIEGVNANQAYHRLAHEVLRGEEITARGLKTLELSPCEVAIYDPQDRIVESEARALSLRYLVGELCWYFNGSTDLASIAHYSKFWEKASDDGRTLRSSYGYRLFRQTDQLGYARDCLIEDAYSRKAVMVIYDQSDMRKSRDNPCTLSLQFMIRNKRLNLIVTMRSNDVWLGFPYDVAFFTLLQEIMLVMLRSTYPSLVLGTYYHHVGSMHGYATDYEKILRVTEEPLTLTNPIPRLVSTDVCDWFNDLLTFEKSQRGIVLYKEESRRTEFQDWCKQQLR
jgi:thymidylate synthase